MKKKASSQWDFDDLFSLAEKRKSNSAGPVNDPRQKESDTEHGTAGDSQAADFEVEVSLQTTNHEPTLIPPQDLTPMTVTQLTSRLRSSLEREFGDVRVSGEVTNLRVQSSGHIYFTIKDRNAQLQCVLFRGQKDVDRDLIADGRELCLSGNISVYEPRGQYQLIVKKSWQIGLGALQAEFDRLKARLQQAGLFDQETKKPLPAYMWRIGLVTSPTGAAIRDVLHVIERRFPGMEIILVPCRVQGTEAGTEVARAIGILNEYHSGGGKLDAILVTRGGGSLEDLWAFNEEVVARAIFNSQLPVISAVGHEIDFTISDFVADFRAATPSAAAEVITEGFVRSRGIFSNLNLRMRRAVMSGIRGRLDRSDSLSRRLARRHPRRVLEQNFQKLDDTSLRFNRLVRRNLSNRQERLSSRVRDLSRFRPSVLLKGYRDRLDEAVESMHDSATLLIRNRNQRLERLSTKLALLSPQSVLDRGYAIACKSQDSKSGTPVKVLRSSTEVVASEKISVRLRDGVIEAEVLKSSESQPLSE